MKRLFILASLALLILSGCAAPKVKGSLTVGLECNYAPFNWTQLTKTATSVAVDGDAASFCDGYDIAIARAIADKLGRTLVVKKIAWDGLVTSLKGNDIDMIVAGMTDTPERRLEVAFSTPYYDSELVLIVRTDSKYASATSLADFTGATVIAQKSTFHNDVAIPAIPGVVHGTPLDSFPLLANAIVMKDADAMVSEYPVAKAIVASNASLKIIQFATGKGFQIDPSYTTVSVAVRKADTELLASINKVLAGISTSTRNQWMIDAGARQPK
jgi:ABC-type amino acid transport substrate-binding protein